MKLFNLFNLNLFRTMIYIWANLLGNLKGHTYKNHLLEIKMRWLIKCDLKDFKTKKYSSKDLKDKLIFYLFIGFLGFSMNRMLYVLFSKKEKGEKSTTCKCLKHKTKKTSILRYTNPSLLKGLGDFSLVIYLNYC